MAQNGDLSAAVRGRPLTSSSDHLFSYFLIVTAMYWALPARPNVHLRPPLCACSQRIWGYRGVQLNRRNSRYPQTLTKWSISVPLTDLKIKTTKPANKPFKLSDGGGLYLLVSLSGSKLWRMKYRYLGAERSLSFGPYPTITLKAARELREDARRRLAADEDPVEIKRQKKLSAAMAAAQTFGLIAEEYLTKQAADGRATSHRKALAFLRQIRRPDRGSRVQTMDRASRTRASQG